MRRIDPEVPGGGLGGARLRAGRAAAAGVFALMLVGALWSAPAGASVVTPPARTGAPAAGERSGSSLEAAATRAGQTGRAVAMSLIGLAFAVAAIVLAFRRDFKEAVGVFAVGVVSVLLATPEGVSLLRDTVASVFGAP